MSREDSPPQCPWQKVVWQVCVSLSVCHLSQLSIPRRYTPPGLEDAIDLRFSYCLSVILKPTSGPEDTMAVRCHCDWLIWASSWGGVCAHMNFCYCTFWYRWQENTKPVLLIPIPSFFIVHAWHIFFNFPKIKKNYTAQFSGLYTELRKRSINPAVLISIWYQMDWSAHLYCRTPSVYRGLDYMRVVCVIWGKSTDWSL